jgi:hypothetical protein
MAGKKGGLEVRRRSIVDRCNRLLKWIAGGKIKKGTMVRDMSERLGLSQDGTYHCLKRLYSLKRLKRATVDGTLWWKVLNPEPVTLGEIIELGDPYDKGNKNKRGGRKPGSKNKPKTVLPAVMEPKPQLKNPMVIYDHPKDEGIRITLDGAPEACAAFLKQLGRGS